MRHTTLALVLLLALTPPAVMAGHGGEPITVQRCYDTGQPGQRVTTQPDPVGVSCGGTLDVGGVVDVEVPEAAKGGTVQITVVDDTWGVPAAGGVVCSDVDGDGACGPEEPSKRFCGGASIVGGELVRVSFHDPVEQVLRCDNPRFATSGGVTSPAGGLFLTFG